MSDKKPSNTFKSYVDLVEANLDNSNDDSFAEHFTPFLLPREMLIAEAQNVLMFNNFSERKQGKSGVLCVTNFKLSFITSDDRPKEGPSCRDRINLGENDVCLSNVHALFLLGEKKKKLIPGKNSSEKIKGLLVHCKNMKSLSFSFKFSPVGHGKTLVNTLLHHAFPKRHRLLFAYDYVDAPLSCRSGTQLFRESRDWTEELKRTGGLNKGWRLSEVNRSFQLSPDLPQRVIVPTSVQDHHLKAAGKHFRCGRPPLWSYSTPKGAALVRMADIISSNSDRVQENIMLESVRKCHPKLQQPIVMDLTKDLPLPKDVFISYMKLRDLCCPDDIRQFWIQDNNFHSLLESSKWLQYVSTCLSKSLEAAQTLFKDVTVVLQELDGRDMCCVISCLTQLLIDPHFRTMHGFQSLIQREWVVMGHPFCSRLGHIYGPETEHAPLFLLFLDCTWQLLQQFPLEFQFTETYLTTLWDSVFISIYETFLFDCEKDRKAAANDSTNRLVLRNVWDDQLGFYNPSLFNNVLYKAPESMEPHRPLNVSPGIACLEFWQQCYSRHIPILEIKGGGNPQVDLQCRKLVAQLYPTDDTSTDVTDSGIDLSTIGSFFPFSPTIQSPAQTIPLSASLIVSSLSLNQSFSSAEYMLDSQSIISSPD